MFIDRVLHFDKIECLNLARTSLIRKFDYVQKCGAIVVAHLPIR